jgi:hypothetical protein
MLDKKTQISQILLAKTSAEKKESLLINILEKDNNQFEFIVYSKRPINPEGKNIQLIEQQTDQSSAVLNVVTGPWIEHWIKPITKLNIVNKTIQVRRLAKQKDEKFNKNAIRSITSFSWLN